MPNSVLDWNKHYSSMPTDVLIKLSVSEAHKVIIRQILHERAVREREERMREALPPPEVVEKQELIAKRIILLSILLVVSPFILWFVIPWIHGWPIAIYHLVFIVMLWRTAANHESISGDMGPIPAYMMWGIFIIVDFPVSILLVFAWWILNKTTESDIIKVSLIPSWLFGTVGTYWWYAMPLI